MVKEVNVENALHVVVLAKACGYLNLEPPYS